ncbi:MAG: DNA repair protein RecO [Anaeroplasmataceae bacterium]|nr:DNA repair protein RecO [Anaeroplasmataceae bacterium]MDE5868112.1 DNA repair protein RecO [Anaeroplasmataceae bacterium]
MEGIVLKSISYKEKSKLVYLYTPLGKKSVLVHDLNKNVGFTTTLSIVSFETTNQKLPVLTSYHLIESHFDLDVHKIDDIRIMLEVLEQIPEDSNHTRIYPFFIRCFDALLKSLKPQFYLLLFLTKMLSVFGVRPEFQNCVLCGNKEIASFSILDGGVLCSSCSVTNDYGLELYRSFKELYYAKNYDAEIYSINYKMLMEAIYSYYKIHTHISLKSFQNRLDKNKEVL